MAEAKVGVIGGSGLYAIEGLADMRAVEVSTPFGAPSDRITLGTLEGVRVAFLPRHGVGHRILPTELPVRANIYALKSLGVERIIAVSACGSLKEEYPPGHIVVPDQIYDRTRNREEEYTFFGRGIVAHVSFADPFCPDLSGWLYETGKEIGALIHRGGTYVCIEGPTFSTKAESAVYRSQGFDVIGMTAVPEAKLAREAELCYAMLAIVTDYDVWHDEPVTQEMVLRTMEQNIGTARRLVRGVLSRIAERRCTCGTAMDKAILTDPALIPLEARDRLGLIVGKYLP